MALASVAACKDPAPIIGGSCHQAAAECAPSPYRCLSGDYCTRECSVAADCPSGSVCVGPGASRLCLATCVNGACVQGGECKYDDGPPAGSYCVAHPFSAFDMSSSAAD